MKPECYFIINKLTLIIPQTENRIKHFSMTDYLGLLTQQMSKERIYSRIYRTIFFSINLKSF